jgi:hypothetical protein
MIVNDQEFPAGMPLTSIGVRSAFGKCDHVNEMLAILGRAFEYGKNCIALEKHVKCTRMSFGLQGVSLHDSFGVCGMAVNTFNNLAV